MSIEHISGNRIYNASVSVVITCFNDSPVFTRCLESVLNQTVKPQEIIIVDDCSNDSAKIEEIINSYNDNTIIYIRNEVNKNGAFSRNRGMSISTSDYIALLDGDDYWKKNHIEQNLIFLQSKKIDFTYSDVIEIRANGEEKLRKVTDIATLENKNDILFYSPPQTNSFFFKKTVYDFVKFDESLRRHQDFQFLITAINTQNIELAYNNIATSYYCESHRPSAARVDYDSIFRFWDIHSEKFTKLLLNHFLKQQLHSCIVIKKGEGIIDYQKKYGVLNNNDLQNSLYLKLINLIGCTKTISRMVLYFYYHVVYGKLSFNKKFASKLTNQI